MSQTALDAYIDDLKEGGILLIDPNSVKRVPEGVYSYEVPAMEIAHEVGNVKYQNSVTLGALSALLNDRIKKDSLARTITETVPGKTLEKNLEAFERGWSHVSVALNLAI
jgi:2-oxoglutarate ferredoxin oxidoreductase subunit gamma